MKVFHKQSVFLNNAWKTCVCLLLLLAVFPALFRDPASAETLNLTLGTIKTIDVQNKFQHYNDQRDCVIYLDNKICSGGRGENSVVKVVYQRSYDIVKITPMSYGSTKLDIVLWSYKYSGGKWIPMSRVLTYEIKVGASSTPTPTPTPTSAPQTSYYIYYYANGGSGAPSTQVKSKGQTIRLSSQAPTREGYDFIGWATSSTATTARYQPGDLYSGNSNLNLYAVWQPSYYLVSYSANGGSGAPEMQYKDRNSTLKLSDTVPVRKGYAFQGWATSATASGAQYQPGDSYTSNSSVTLYAVWKEKTVTSMSLSETNAEVKIGRSKWLTVSFSPEDALSTPYVSWHSSNQNVATVSISGEVTGVGSGTATITASAENGLSASCKVTVSPVYPERIVLNHTELTLERDESAALTATILPSDTYQKSVRWVSSSTDLTVNNGVISSSVAGSYTVTAVSVADPSVTAVCSVTVFVNPDKLVPINDVTFPDPVFRAYILAEADNNNNGYLGEKEIELADMLFLDGMEIADLSGIEYLSELEWINCSDSLLRSVNLSHFPELEYVSFEGCAELESVTISDCEKLDFINLTDSSVRLLDLVDCPNLDTLACAGCPLTTLSLVGCTALETLFCYDCTALSMLDISNCEALTELYCANCNLDSLDVSGFSQLRILRCEDNQIPALDLRGLDKLEELIVENNPLVSLQLGSHPSLELLYCNGTNIQELNLSACPILVDTFENGTYHTTAFSICYHCLEDPTDPYSNFTSILDLPLAITLYAGEWSQFGQAELVLPTDLNAIAENAFEGIAARSVEIPEGCMLIGANAFRNSRVVKIRIPAGCVIDDTAFDGCERVVIYGSANSTADDFAFAHQNCRFVSE